MGCHANCFNEGRVANEQYCVNRQRCCVVGRDKPSELSDLLQACQMLDWRSLEDAFLLFASLEVMKKYNLQLENVLCNRNGLSELVVGQFHDAFAKKWGGK